MPEIWLVMATRCGADIKFENLANQISSTFQVPLQQDAKTAITSGVPLTDKMLFQGCLAQRLHKIIMMPQKKPIRGYNALQSMFRTRSQASCAPT